MNLQDLTSGTVNNKPWLNIVANSIKTKSLETDTAIIPEISSDLLNLNNQISVPNAPIGSTSFFSSGSGNLSQTDELGNTVEYVTTDFVGDYLPLDGSQPMQGSIQMAGYNISNVQNIIGSVKTNPVNNLTTSNASSVVDGDVPVFDLTTGKVIKNSSIASSNLLLADGSVLMTGDLNLGNFTSLHKSNQPSSLSKYSITNEGTNLSDTVVETSFLTGPSVGSLIYDANSTSGGTIFRLTASFFLSSAVDPHTITFRLKTGITVLNSLVWTPGNISNIPCKLIMDVSIRNDNATVGSGTLFINGVLPVLSNTNSSWDPSLSNTLDFTGEWSDASASDSCGLNSFYIESLYQA